MCSRKNKQKHNSNIISLPSLRTWTTQKKGEVAEEVLPFPVEVGEGEEYPSPVAVVEEAEEEDHLTAKEAVAEDHQLGEEAAEEQRKTECKEPQEEGALTCPENVMNLC